MSQHALVTSMYVTEDYMIVIDGKSHLSHYKQSPQDEYMPIDERYL